MSVMTTDISTSTLLNPCSFLMQPLFDMHYSKTG
jgi:hypothetical protein